MSSVLPDMVAPPSYASASAHAGTFTDSRGIAWPRRAPLNRGVTRTTECPCAVRLYHLTSSDVAARSEYCGVVLGAPSVGIQDAMRVVAEAALPTATATAAEAPGPATASPAVAAAAAVVVPPLAVQLAWADTTVWEVAHTALLAVRAEVDAFYTAERRRLAAKGRVHSTMSAAEEDVAEEGETEAEAPFTTVPHRYEVELLTGSVNPMGQASTIPLCVVTCRQVLPGHPALLPMRRNDSVDYNTALYELPYNLGDPVFVTCKRTI